MPKARATEGQPCGKCEKVFTNMMRLQHHRAADHAPKNLRDIRTMKNIKHSTGD